MPQWVRNILTSPRTWLATGAFCIGSTFVLGYYADQQNAYQALHKKVGTPQETFIQDFVPEKHMNMINHVNVLGELVSDRNFTINLGSDDAPHWLYVVPVFPVGSETMPLALQEIARKADAARRPMPREHAFAISQQQLIIDALQSQAFAFVVKNLSDIGDTAAYLAEGDVEVLADLETRQLVRLTGSIVNGRNLQVRLSAELLHAGVASTPDTLMIEPPSQISAELISENALLRARTWLISFGIFFAVVGAAMPMLVTAAPRRTLRAAATETVAASHAFPAVRFFQPIATQDELSQQEDAAERFDQGKASGVFLAVIAAVADRMQTMTRIRSPR